MSFADWWMHRAVTQARNFIAKDIFICSQITRETLCQTTSFCMETLWQYWHPKNLFKFFLLHLTCLCPEIFIPTLQFTQTLGLAPRNHPTSSCFSTPASTEYVLRSCKLLTQMRQCISERLNIPLPMNGNWCSTGYLWSYKLKFPCRHPKAFMLSWTIKLGKFGNSKRKEEIWKEGSEEQDRWCYEKLLACWTWNFDLYF